MQPVVEAAVEPPNADSERTDGSEKRGKRHVKETKKKGLEIPNVAIRSRVGSPRTGNLINSRPEGLRPRVSSNDDGQSRATEVPLGRYQNRQALFTTTSCAFRAV